MGLSWTISREVLQKPKISDLMLPNRILEEMIYFAYPITSSQEGLTHRTLPSRLRSMITLKLSSAASFRSSFSALIAMLGVRSMGRRIDNSSFGGGARLPFWATRGPSSIAIVESPLRAATNECWVVVREEEEEEEGGGGGEEEVRVFAVGYLVSY